MTTPTFEALVADYRRMGYSPAEAFLRAVEQGRGRSPMPPSSPFGTVEETGAPHPENQGVTEDSATRHEKPTRDP
jgi:hypothetical protein